MNPSSLTLQPLLLVTHLGALHNLQETQKRTSKDKFLNPHSTVYKKEEYLWETGMIHNIRAFKRCSSLKEPSS